jgi:hypothetical protein
MKGRSHYKVLSSVAGIFFLLAVSYSSVVNHYVDLDTIQSSQVESTDSTDNESDGEKENEEEKFDDKISLATDASSRDLSSKMGFFCLEQLGRSFHHLDIPTPPPELVYSF